MQPPARHLAATRGKTDPAEQEFSVGFVCRGLVGAVFRPFLTPLVTKRSRNGRPRLLNFKNDSSANYVLKRSSRRVFYIEFDIYKEADPELFEAEAEVQ